MDAMVAQLIRWIVSASLTPTSTQRDTVKFEWKLRIVVYPWLGWSHCILTNKTSTKEKAQQYWVINNLLLKCWLSKLKGNTLKKNPLLKNLKRRWFEDFHLKASFNSLFDLCHLQRKEDTAKLSWSLSPSYISPFRSVKRCRIIDSPFGFRLACQWRRQSASIAPFACCPF